MYCERYGYDVKKNLGACTAGSPVPGVGNPINTGIYNKFQLEDEFTFGAGIHQRAIGRVYNSAKVSEEGAVYAVPQPVLFGPHWASTFDRRLVTYSYGANGTTYAVRPDGKAYFFNKSGALWIPDPDVSDTLTRLVDAGGTHLGWTYVEASTQDVETYDVGGRLTQLRTRAGHAIDLFYAGDRLETVRDAFGRELIFSYGSNGLVSSVSAPSVGTYQYRYDARYNLTEVEQPNGAVRRYHYENTTFGNALTGISDELGVRYSTYGYDTYGSATLTQLAGGVNRYTIAQVGGVLRITDSRSFTTDQGFVNVQGVAKIASSTQPCASCGGAGAGSAYAYDTNGNLTSKTDFRGKKACYAHDITRNLETARVEGLTSEESCTTSLATPPDRPDVRKITTTWHATWRLPATIVESAPGGTKSTAFTYDANGNLTQRKNTAPRNDGTAATITRVWKWTYGTYGRVLTATDPNNKVTTTTYHPDADPDFGKRGQVATVTSPLGHVRQFTAYDAAGRLTTLADANGVVSSMTYDLRGRLTSRTVGGELTTYTYDLAGQLIDVDLPDGAMLAYVYDDAHRLTEIHDGLGNKIVYTLDGMGNRTAEQAFDPTGTLARTRTRVYDSLNRLSQDVGAQSQATVMTYDGNGNRLTSTDPLSHITTSTYDALNRLLTVTQPGGPLIQYAYDKASNLTTVTDPRTLVTTYGYDGLDNQVTLASPDTGITTRTFDAAGNVKTSTDARGAKATYTYDGAGRVTRIVHSQTGFPSETHTYTWDGGTAGAPNAKGRLTKLVDPSGTTKWTYTPHGRVASREQVAGSVTLTQSHAWTDGRLAGITTPSGQAIGYSYANGRIVGITLNGSPLVTAGTYEPFGQVSAWTWGNGHRTFRDHDTDGRLITWEYRNGSSVIRRDLTWDPANRITAITDPTSAANSATYSYDELDRLTSAQAGGSTRGYGYDAIGNRTGSTHDAASTNYGYAGTSNRLESLTGATNRSYTYDSVGNPTAIGNVTYGYNLANRMTSVSGGASATYKVNGLGQRVAKTVGGTTTRYFYDEQGRLVGEYQSNGTLIQETVWLDDLPVATLRPTGTGTPPPIAVYYVHADQLGTPRAITRPSDDAFVWKWENDEPFGNNAANENPAGIGNFRYAPRFPGQQYDPETGTHYNYFRDYDPVVGRYQQSDPIGLEGGINTYGYVTQNPLRNADPTGEQITIPFPPVAGIGGPIGIGIGLGLSYLISEMCKPPCPPCSPYKAGTMGYIGPHADHDHFPVGRPHLNLFVVNQRSDCKCFWNKASPDVARPPPAPDWVDLNNGFPPLSP
jgi:RHS repeat-associated protein